MGNVVPTGRAAGDARELLKEADGAELAFQEKMWNGKFLKSVRGQQRGTDLVLKVYEKLPGASDATALAHVRRQLAELRDTFQPHLHPNVLPYSSWSETPRVCVLMRQFVASNLYDRQSTRPFLDPMEKRWIAFQLLSAVAQAHNAQVAHGDIKAENILVTSWNWILLTDFAPFKPTFLPLDDTAPYNYFFASSTNRDCCCVAPERFCSPTSIIDISLLDSAPAQCSSFLSVMVDGNVPAMDAEHALAVDAHRDEAAAGAETPDFADAEADLDVPPIASPRAGRRQRSYSFGSSRESVRLRPSMDIFSLGCVLAELFQDGEPCFGLGELLRYAKREPENRSHLALKLGKAKLPLARPLLEHMLCDNPALRQSADSYLADHTGPGKLFPAYFAEVLHPFFAQLLASECDAPDDRIWAICRQYATLLEAACQQEDKLGARFFADRFAEWERRNSTSPSDHSTSRSGQGSEEDEFELDEGLGVRRGAARDREHASHNDVVKDLLAESASILEALSELSKTPPLNSALQAAKGQVSSMQRRVPSSDAAAARGETQQGASGQGNRRAKGLEAEDFVGPPFSAKAGGQGGAEGENGSVLLLSLICSTVQYVRFPATKVVSLRLLQRISRYTDDETRLQRVVPYVVSLLEDHVPAVRCTAVRVLTSVLAMIHTVPGSDRRIFPDYLFPHLARSKIDTALSVRVALAECLPRLAELSARFLEISWVTRTDQADGASPDKLSYDASVEELHNIMLDFLGSVIEHKPVVRRALLSDITRLCLFFGQERISSNILPMLITFLNERTDWQLRATFFEQIPGVAALVGPLALQQFLLPCILQSLQDVEELVIERTLSCLYSLVRLGLLDYAMMADITIKAAPLVYHPGSWIRHAVLHLLATLVSQERFSIVEVQVLIVHLLRQFVPDESQEGLLLLGRTKNVEENERLLRGMVGQPLSRELFDAKLEWLERQSVLPSPLQQRQQQQQQQQQQPPSPRREDQAELKRTQQEHQQSPPSTSQGSSQAQTHESTSAPPSVGSAATQPAPLAGDVAPSAGGSARSSGAESEPGAGHDRQKSGFGSGSGSGQTGSPGEHSPKRDNMAWLKLMPPWGNKAGANHGDSSSSNSSSLNSSGSFDGGSRGGSHPFGADSRPGSQGGSGERDADAILNGASASDRAKLDAMAQYMIGAISARRGDRSKQGVASELPRGFTTPSSHRAQVYGIVVPDQHYASLAIHSNYADWLDQPDASNVPGSFLRQRHDDFRRLVNKHGVVPRFRRHHGITSSGHAIVTSEALSGGENRLLHRLQALNVPPLPPDMGSLRRLANGQRYVENVRRPSAELGSLVAAGADGAPSSTRAAAATSTVNPWRPRGVLAANLFGHNGAVNRICASKDSLFFATGSDDGTVRLWLTAGIEEGFGIRPKLTYASQGGKITDLCIVDNTHAIASASTAGSVHVFKIEHALEVARQASDASDTGLVSAESLGDDLGAEDAMLDRSEARRLALGEQHQQAHGGGGGGGSALLGTGAGGQRMNLGASTVQELNLADDGAVRALCYFPTLTESMLTFATDSGVVHGWDLRAGRRAWALPVGLQAGLLTALAVPPEGDAVWLVAGTSRGFVLLFDLRFQVLLRAWRHSSRSRIHRVYISRATCSDPFVYIAAGTNEAALFNLSDGTRVQTFKTVPHTVESITVDDVDKLEPVDIGALAPLTGPSRLHAGAASASISASAAVPELEDRHRPEPSVRAILCPFDAIDGSSNQGAHIPSAVITAGTDRHIRYWHAEEAFCYSIFDQEFGAVSKQYWDALQGVTVCRVEGGSPREPQQPSAEGRGLPHPSFNHDDAILDLAFVASHRPVQGSGKLANPGFLLSASRDGVVKAWV